MLAKLVSFAHMSRCKLFHPYLVLQKVWGTWHAPSDTFKPEALMFEEVGMVGWGREFHAVCRDVSRVHERLFWAQNTYVVSSCL